MRIADDELKQAYAALSAAEKRAVDRGRATRLAMSWELSLRLSRRALWSGFVGYSSIGERNEPDRPHID